MIPFNKPPITGQELEYIKDVIESGHLCGDGKYTKFCHEWLEENTGTKKALLTTSCTHALEMAALLLDIQPGDEVIMPSYTFVSTANAFVLRGAKIVFVDIRPDTMNIDEKLVEAAVTEKTKVIVPVHYAGVGCEMDTIMEIAQRHNLFVVEDAAQGLMAKYKGKMLGTIGHLGTYSFHETKNFVSGEGGALLINDERFIERAEIIREKGTNRSQFFRGQVDKYTWQDIGSSYLPSELNAAYLYAQLLQIKQLHQNRLNKWNTYNNGLKSIRNIELPQIPEECKHNGHIFYIKVKDLNERTSLIKFLKENEIQSTFHYVPLHSSPAGLKYGNLINDEHTTKESNRLVRLPLYNDLNKIQEIINRLEKYCRGE
ncbi:dTDP-4-amino-4,6-dideoxygalactose transaminase [Solibacillus daqui]|uniref:dTDP-4-amino-4,6-dideoxygalactose transaminase n=1 Tax=Solibacillus daqui TaxID=2912187 RepID=UPI0023663662|nr:dTDP-4-amino-4,6-dideoxygalactose transaminase [Solibacillus daqui]